MKFIVSNAKPKTYRADMIAIGCFEREREEGSKGPCYAIIKHADGGIALDKAMGGLLSKQVAAEKFTGERGTHRIFFTAGKIPAKYVLIVGLGKRDKFNLEVLREAGATMTREASSVRLAQVALVLEQGALGDDTSAERARAIAEGVIMGAYKFDRYKTGEKEEPSHKITAFLYDGNVKRVRDEIENGKIAAEAVCKCRDMVNTPAADITPTILAKYARETAKQHGLSCEVLGLEEIKKEKMDLLLAVAKGSVEPPTFIVLKYKPKEKPRAHLALVGKGITFDAGGLEIKLSKYMEHMKDDMAGGAAVIAAMEAIAKLKPPVEITGLIPAAENLPDGKALKTGDIVTARNGKTIEILSTDGEGRLILADALSYAVDLKPDAIVDVATLTGGAVYCCGELYTLAMGNDQKLVDRLKKSSDAVGEYMWQLPIVEEYKKGYTSGIADLNNTGKNKAQTILGAIFLREFIGKTPWAHLDIAASSWTDEELPTSRIGATGAPVRTLVSFAMNFKKLTVE